MANSLLHLEPDSLWAKLGAAPLLRDFSPSQRDGLLQACGSDPAIGVRRFAAGELICRKGEYELDLCVVLSGSLEMRNEDQPPEQRRVATLAAGDFYGELGAMAGLPRTLDIRALADCEIFYLPRHALKLVETNPTARSMLAERYRARALMSTAAEMDLFNGVPAEAIAGLIPHSEIIRHDLRGVPLVKQGEPGEAFYLIREGFVQLVREHEDGSKRVLAYLRAGEYFGEMALFETGVRWASVLTAGKCELIRIGREDLLALCRRFPQLEQRLRQVMAERHEQDRRITPELSALLEKSGQLGVIQADALLVMDLDLCVGCDACVDACEALHGRSRLIRNGIQIGKYLIPSACRHCDDPRCMNSCPTGAIRRRAEGEIYFEYESCIGCGNCAIACPFDNIAMIDTPTFAHAQARKARTAGTHHFFRPYPVAAHDVGEPGLWDRLRGALGLGGRKPVTLAGAVPEHTPAAFPIKCDLCDGLPFMGCVHNCPTGAAMRIDPAELFEDSGAIRAGTRVRKARGGSD